MRGLGPNAHSPSPEAVGQREAGRAGGDVAGVVPPLDAMRGMRRVIAWQLEPVGGIGVLPALG